MSQSELLPAITVLERRLQDAERKANDIRNALNVLRVEAGMPPLPGGPSGSGGGTDRGPAISQIGPDTFYGKRMQTAVREYLEMRKRQGGPGPARPREIYEAIVAGGYQFDASTPDVALVGLRAMLRKRTAVFHKLPNGTYGLTAWYPDAKKPKPSTATPPGGDDDTDDDADTETAASPEDESDDAAVA